MIYVTSDLHGYPLKDLQRLLDHAGFCPTDELFVLGDVIDRGPEGVELLQWCMRQQNVRLLMGNHEAMLLSCSILFEEITDDSIESLTDEQCMALQNWVMNGAGETIDGLYRLRRKSMDELKALLDYIRRLPLYDTVSVNGRDFLLIHAGLKDFSPDRKPSEYAPYDLVWHRPKLQDRYFPHITTILGHTPTKCYSGEWRALHTDTWIDIDTGSGHGGAPMLLRLDDMREFYVDDIR